jgi:hypothetical protein
MVLMEKWLVIRMGLRDALVEILGVDGEYPNQSVWLGTVPDGDERPTHLIRWELIANGTVYESRTIPAQTVSPH